jgi:hypothetical protein
MQWLYSNYSGYTVQFAPQSRNGCSGAVSLTHQRGKRSPLSVVRRHILKFAFADDERDETVSMTPSHCIVGVLAQHFGELHPYTLERISLIYEKADVLKDSRGQGSLDLH